MGNLCNKEPAVAGIVDNVPAYYNRGINFRSNYITIDNRQVFTGVRFQCVEYARRYLILTKGVVFGDVGCAYHIFDLNTVTDIMTQQQRQFQSIPQGSSIPPQKGDLVIYQKSGKQWWGHVAVVTNVNGNLVDLAEQNYDEDWDNCNYARQVLLKKEGDQYFLTNIRQYKPYAWDLNEVIIGWKRAI
ncbi:unnamed protein product [Paramecium primaurelia]|uniref:Peptidase C51 domain-containing protein n=1 Tax=Paramecium primaurelia TaxID=5886 RepID=A0A8S1ME74_PARPR|nr:unnamed protein product [Paramecium primaurelia]CAD8077839.1 unnamed protein product [Paramecium primaurelia]